MRGTGARARPGGRRDPGHLSWLPHNLSSINLSHHTHRPPRSLLAPVWRETHWILITAQLVSALPEKLPWCYPPRQLFGLTGPCCWPKVCLHPLTVRTSVAHLQPLLPWDVSLGIHSQSKNPSPTTCQLAFPTGVGIMSGTAVAHFSIRDPSTDTDQCVS